jgi:hypothetical protein
LRLVPRAADTQCGGYFESRDVENEHLISSCLAPADRREVTDARLVEARTIVGSDDSAA